MSEDKTEGPRGFARFIETVNYGEAHAELSDKLFELGNEIRKQQIEGSKLKVSGSLVLTIKITAEGDGPVIVSTDVGIKKPKVKRAASIYWLTKDGNLTDTNPRQLALGLRDASRVTEIAREALAKSQETREAP